MNESTLHLPIPKIFVYQGVFVVRDDFIQGGTKARFLPALFKEVDELVYASPAEGGAQTALATVARLLGKRVTIFVAARATPHARTLVAADLGASIRTVKPGYLSVVQARARDYADRMRARLVPFGADVPGAVEAITEAAIALQVQPDEVWCAAGSGVLARGLGAAWRMSRLHVVQVGRTLSATATGKATVHIYPAAFGREARIKPPFPSDPHYDAKAWELCLARKGSGRVLFWNVAGPARCGQEACTARMHP
jgi:hypothetical protein